MARLVVRLQIEGRVQGVGYRWWAVGEARRLGLAGWVRNRREGWVELLAAGEADAVDALVQACHHGPRGAQVTAVTPVAATDDVGDGFEERATL
ncbi:acylphosphatase [Phenylobacterium sp.]|jgi:acylphosphatase|uniref:acylphosphatase n=1 Tax=Phenylobacterium sp. TaxID=1871053 RepID=UPI002F958F86